MTNTKRASIDLTYIISAFARPDLLATCLHSIANQTHSSFEVIVTDNARDTTIIRQHLDAVTAMKDQRFIYLNTHKCAGNDCYESAQWAIDNHAAGTWLTFPCDDCYYVPGFGQRMLAAAYKGNWDLVYCNEVISPAAGGGGGYHEWDVQPNMMPKPSFIIRASAFPGWCDRPKGDVPVSCDYVLGQTMAGKKTIGKLAETLVVHN